ADAAVFLGNQRLMAESLLLAIAPVAADTGVEQLRKRLGQAIGQGLGHDRLVVVVSGLETSGQLVSTKAGGEGEGAEIIVAAAVERRQVIGQAAEARLSLAFPLLAEHGKAAALAGSRVVGEDDQVVAVAGRREEAIDGMRGQQLILH